MLTLLVVVHESQLSLYVWTLVETSQAKVGVVREGIVSQLQLQGGLCKEEVPQPVIREIKAIQLHREEIIIRLIS